MDGPADPPTAAAVPRSAAAAKTGRRLRWPTLSPRVGCLAVWVVGVAPVAYSLLLAGCPPFARWVSARLAAVFPPPDSPPFFVPWLAPGPAGSVSEWLSNFEPGQTMVYLIFVAALMLFSMAVLVRDEQAPQR